MKQHRPLISAYFLFLLVAFVGFSIQATEDSEAAGQPAPASASEQSLVPHTTEALQCEVGPEEDLLLETMAWNRGIPLPPGYVDCPPHRFCLDDSYCAYYQFCHPWGICSC